MGWFDEQIRQREESDRAVLEDSFFRMANAVMDRWEADRLEDRRLIAKEAIDQILKYYHYQPVEIPENIRGEAEQLEYAMRPAGLVGYVCLAGKQSMNEADGLLMGMKGGLLHHGKGSGDPVSFHLRAVDQAV